ncbi:MAG: magnesium transporter [Terrimicrobiaceae bacterium]|nr:magnesium transporter [Terrimicrobiaceae bacterium]
MKTQPVTAIQLELLGPSEAADALRSKSPEEALEFLENLSPDRALDALQLLPSTLQTQIKQKAPAELAQQWELAAQFPQNSVGRLVKPTLAVFSPEMTVGEAVERLSTLINHEFITYLFVVNSEFKLLGIITMRDLLFSDKSSCLENVMLRDVFALDARTDLLSAMRATLGRHFPVYPVVDPSGKFLGVVRGSALFEAQAFELTAQAGRMVGVESEERLGTPWRRSFLFRHPWLQLNLLTAFLAAAVVGVFEETIAQVVALAVFLPVLAGQSGNTGCQALAVALRAITLGELDAGRAGRAVLKEGVLGLLNGVFVGITAGLGMFIFASWQKNPQALLLSLVVFLAMVGSCMVSGISGAAIPVILRRLGADPATASSIFLTTATDVVSMGLFLWLATILVL